MRELKNLFQQVYCTGCRGKRNHKILVSYQESSSPFDDYDWRTDYHIVKCSGCDEVAFVKQSGNEDSWDSIDGHKVYYDTFTVYPEEPMEEEEDSRLPERYRLTPKVFEHVPHNIIDLYNQIVESYNMKHFILCTSGLRTLIEGMCSELGIRKGYLYDKEGNKLLDEDQVARKKDSLGARIFGLFEGGYIIFPQALILQKIKDIGNIAIHDITVPEVPTIKEIINVVENVIYYIYEIGNHRLLRD